MGRGGFKMNYTKSAYRLETKRIKEPDFPYHAQAALNSPENVVAFVRALQESDIEKMIILHLNTQHKLICIQIQTGTIDKAVIYPREIIKHSLLSGGASIVIVHNHPGENPEPSLEDHGLTKKIFEACNTLDIHLLDHIIIGDNSSFVSFATLYLLPQKST